MLLSSAECELMQGGDMKFRLSNVGVIKYPDYAGKSYAMSTWRKKIGSDSKFVENFIPVSEEKEPASEKKYSWSCNSCCDYQYGERHCGRTMSEPEWVAIIGLRYFNALRNDGVICEVTDDN